MVGPYTRGWGCSVEGAEPGLVTQQSFVQFVFWLPALLIGVAVGAKGFHRIDQVRFRRYVLIILVALAVISLVKAAIDLHQTGMV